MIPLVIVPTYNERANLPRLAAAMLDMDGFRLLVVDDGSPDGTGEDADRLAAASGGRVAVLHRAGNRGLGRSYIDGMRTALRTDATHICQMDADLSHDPADLAAPDRGDRPRRPGDRLALRPRRRACATGPATGCC